MDRARTRLRENEILDLLAVGKSNAEIAETLWIAPGTVRKHLEHVYEKEARRLEPDRRGREGAP